MQGCKVELPAGRLKRPNPGRLPVKNTVRHFLAGSVLMAFGAALASQDPELWPQWRGPNRDGLIGGPTWPTALKGEALKLLWRVPLWPSYSGPIVSRDR